MIWKTAKEGKRMEDTLLLKGVALFSALIGVQQWLALEVSISDMFFLVTVTAFLVALERDYVKARNKHELPSSRESSPCMIFDPSLAMFAFGALPVFFW